jgi:hypothetical protein
VYEYIPMGRRKTNCSVIRSRETSIQEKGTNLQRFYSGAAAAVHGYEDV